MLLSRISIKFLTFFIIYLQFSNSLQGENPKICLTMIVRNESKIIERCLDSVKDTIDCFSICDTGSDDNTVQIINDYMQKNKIPGKVYTHEWKNFGYNRTLSAKSAQKTLNDLGYSLRNTFLLLIDADMLLVKESSFNKDQLKEDSYLLSQKTPGYSYYNMRLIRASLNWECVGVTHEYWACRSPNASESKINSLWLDDRDDGGCKSDKFERDISMLKKGLLDEPNNVRYLFYLAQSYKSLKKYEDAIKYYQIRANSGGWIEEVWYSKYMIGQAYQEMGEWDQALVAYLDAYQYNPARAEPLQEISKHYRLNEQYNLAYMYAKQGSRIPYPKNDILFISDPVYNYLFDQDISIAAYYTPYKEEGLLANNRLMLRKGIPGHIKEQAYRNAISYVECLPHAQYKTIEAKLPLIRQGFAGHYNPMNPSIRKSEKGYDLILRTVNYIQIGARHFKSLDPLDTKNSAKTRNFLIQYDKNFNLLSQQEIVESYLHPKKNNSTVEGLEDARLFMKDGSIWFSCTTLDTNPTGQPQISLCKLANNRSDSAVKIEKFITLKGPDLKRCEKNWLPFVRNNEFQMIYAYEPVTIYKPILDVESESVVKSSYIRHEKTLTHDFSRFCGSAGPIEWDDGFLVIIHESVDMDQRTYLHRFVKFDQDFTILQVSKPFIFRHKGIEYTCGMTIDHSGNNLIIPIGLEDREAYLCTIDLETVRGLLENLP